MDNQQRSRCCFCARVFPLCTCELPPQFAAFYTGRTGHNGITKFLYDDNCAMLSTFYEEDSSGESAGVTATAQEERLPKYWEIPVGKCVPKD